MNSHNAQKMFEDNLNRFGHAQAEPEKYNLYKGLWNLAAALTGLSTQVEGLKRQVQQLEYQVQYLSQKNWSATARLTPRVHSSLDGQRLDPASDR